MVSARRYRADPRGSADISANTVVVYGFSRATVIGLPSAPAGSSAAADTGHHQRRDDAHRLAEAGGGRVGILVGDEAGVDDGAAQALKGQPEEVEARGA